jgi:hypothetical protein
MTQTPPTLAAPPSVGRLARWKLTEPVRLYLWPVAALLVASGVVGGFRDGDWWRASLFLAAAVAMLLMTAAARASVYSPRAVVQAALRARDQ